MEKNLDLRIQKTYLDLHNAFTDLLEQKHFENITVNELCEKAMIRRTTFYKHFADKYEYFTFYMKEIAHDFYLNARQLETNMSVVQLETFTSFYSGGLLNMLLQYYKKHNSFNEEEFLHTLKKMLF